MGYCEFWSLRARRRPVLQIAGKWIIGNLVIILAQGRNQPKLVRRIEVENQRAEPAISVSPFMHHLWSRWLQAEIASIPVDAPIVGEAFGVAAEADLVIRLVKVTSSSDELSLLVALKTGSRHDVEDAIGPVSIVSVVAAAIDLHVVDIFRIELWPHVAGDVGVGNRHAVHQPTGLVPATDVELVMRDIGPGHIVGDHGHAVGAIRARSPLDIEAADEGGWRGAIRGNDSG